MMTEIKIKGGTICGNLEDFEQPKAVEEPKEEIAEEKPKKKVSKKLDKK